MSSIPIDEQGSDADNPYDEMTRTSVQPQRAPLENYMVRFTSTMASIHAPSIQKYLVLTIILPL
jgi:hypothetical protein